MRNLLPDRSSVPRRADGVVSRTIAGETVLVPVHASQALCDQVFVLNDTGTWLWAAVDGVRDTGALVAALAAEFEIPGEAQARADAQAFFAELTRRGLIEWSAP